MLNLPGCALPLRPALLLHLRPPHAALSLSFSCAVFPSQPPPSILPHSADVGDRPGLETTLPKEAAEEMKKADKGQVFSMCDKPWWDWDAEKEEWGWAREAPVSQKGPGGGSGKQTARKKVGGMAGREVARWMVAYPHNPRGSAIFLLPSCTDSQCNCCQLRGLSVECNLPAVWCLPLLLPPCR